MAKQRISDLPQVTTVTIDDYIIINTEDQTTNKISTYAYSQALVKLMEEDGNFPNINIDGGEIAPIVYDVFDCGSPTTDGQPVATILQGGTPRNAGYGPSADGGEVS